MPDGSPGGLTREQVAELAAALRGTTNYAMTVCLLRFGLAPVDVISRLRYEAGVDRCQFCDRWQAMDGVSRDPDNLFTCAACVGDRA